MPVYNGYAVRKSRDVMQETWGHLEPQAGRYACTILFAHGCYGDIVVLAQAFEKHVDCCPGTHAHLMDYVHGAIKSDKKGLYTFTGVYQRCKNGNGRFLGRVTYRRFAMRSHEKQPDAGAPHNAQKE